MPTSEGRLTVPTEVPGVRTAISIKLDEVPAGGTVCIAVPDEAGNLQPCLSSGLPSAGGAVEQPVPDVRVARTASTVLPRHTTETSVFYTEVVAPVPYAG